MRHHVWRVAQTLRCQTKRQVHRHLVVLILLSLLIAMTLVSTIVSSALILAATTLVVVASPLRVLPALAVLVVKLIVGLDCCGRRVSIIRTERG